MESCGPFGSHMEEGIILSVREESREKLPYKLLNIHSLLDPGPWFTESMLRTALWISSYYVCTLIDALRLFMIDKKRNPVPPGVSNHVGTDTGG